MDFIDSIKKTKEDSFILASLPEEIRNDALERMTKALQANKEAISRRMHRIWSLRRKLVCQLQL